MAQEHTLFEVSLIPKCPDLHDFFPEGFQYLIYDDCPKSALARVYRHVANHSLLQGGSNAFHPYIKSRLVLEVP